MLRYRQFRSGVLDEAAVAGPLDPDDHPHGDERHRQQDHQIVVLIKAAVGIEPALGEELHLTDADGRFRTPRERGHGSRRRCQWHPAGWCIVAEGEGLEAAQMMQFVMMRPTKTDSFSEMSGL